MINDADVQRFLSLKRIAVVGVSDDPKSFGNVIFREMRAHGRDVVPIHPTTELVEDVPCYPDLADVPGEIDGVIIMVPPDRAVAVVDACAAKGIKDVWLFKGVGGPGAVSDEVLAQCATHGMQVVAGACPLMFLEPVGGVHKFHRVLRRWNGALEKAA